MADSRATIGELYKAKAILKADVAAAVDAYMADPTTTLFLFGDGYRIDLAGAVEGSRFASLVVKDVHAADHHKRVAVRTAILLARPEKADASV
ncbi:hypothetical protein [Methylobacterium sp. Leaf89]|uniref:hypothetical protein n=1 Tax=Methylobacterium sp. Leaf89 TaxID=1736245 RepID=UPI0006FC633D|nr:hypothetical protein [Methylobacterium sp. Leaf89]KQO69773.1 hypothetical protein ASF18_21725 [Methylobacterium sp. Leaf89]